MGKLGLFAGILTNLVFMDTLLFTCFAALIVKTSSLFFISRPREKPSLPSLIHSLRSLVLIDFLEINRFIASRIEVLPDPLGPIIKRSFLFRSRSSTSKCRKFYMNNLAMDIS